jgi:hypothetical protein
LRWRTAKWAGSTKTFVTTKDALSEYAEATSVNERLMNGEGLRTYGS